MAAFTSCSDELMVCVWGGGGGGLLKVFLHCKS